MRLFYALWPDAGVAKHLVRAAADLPLGCDVRRVPCGNFHVTLKFIGEVATSQLDILRRIGSAQRAPGCTMTFDAYDYPLARKVAQAPVLQALSPISWNVRSFSLVSSDTSAAHSVYTVVDTWPLLYEKPQA